MSESTPDVDAAMRANLGVTDPAEPGAPGTGEGTVSSQEHQFSIDGLGEGDPAEWDGSFPNGLATTPPGLGVIVLTSGSMGEHAYEWQSSAEPIAEVQEGWDDVVEVLVDAPRGELMVMGWGGEDAASDNLAVAGPGTYVVRVYARGRDIAEYDHVSDAHREQFRFEVWPRTDEGPRVITRGPFTEWFLASTL